MTIGEIMVNVYLYTGMVLIFGSGLAALLFIVSKMLWFIMELLHKHTKIFKTIILYIRHKHEFQRWLEERKGE